MPTDYFSDRERGPRARTEEVISFGAWKALGSLVISKVEDGSLGIDFPATCSDGYIACGCDAGRFVSAMLGEIPELAEWHESVFRGDVYLPNLLGQNQHFPDKLPATLEILDIVEFCYKHVATAQEIDYHGHLSHRHIRFERQSGQAEFREAVNMVFARNGFVYELAPNGEVVRLGPPVLREVLAIVKFATGDSDVDSFLKEAVRKYSNPDLNVRKEALEKLWDAWERLKTLEGGDKKSSIRTLLDKAAPQPVLRKVVEEAADNATLAGNDLMIRHTEVGKEQIERSEVVDYLFHALFALIRFVLRSTGRGG